MTINHSPGLKMMVQEPGTEDGPSTHARTPFPRKEGCAKTGEAMPQTSPTKSCPDRAAGQGCRLGDEASEMCQRWPNL